jgi:hypothetical protein
MSYIIWWFWTSLGLLDPEDRGNTIISKRLELHNVSHPRRLVSSAGVRLCKVMFLCTTVGCLHRCQMVATPPVLRSKVWPISLPCYTHHSNSKSDLNSFPPPGNDASSRCGLSVSISYRFILRVHSLTWWITSVIKGSGKMKLFHLVAIGMAIVIMVYILQRHWTALVRA